MRPKTPIFILSIAVLIMMMTTATANATVSTMGYSCEKSINVKSMDHYQFATTSAKNLNGATTIHSTPALSVDTATITINGTMTVNTMNSTVVQPVNIVSATNSAITASGTEEDTKLKGDLVILPSCMTAITLGFSQAGSSPANYVVTRC